MSLALPLAGSCAPARARVCHRERLQDANTHHTVQQASPTRVVNACYRPAPAIFLFARPAIKYVMTYTNTRYVTAEPGGMQIKDMPERPRSPISCAMRITS